MMDILKWIAKNKPYEHDAKSRWGHHLDDAVDNGFVKIGAPEVFMNGRFRDIRRDVFLTEKGRKEVAGTK